MIAGAPSRSFATGRARWTAAAGWQSPAGLNTARSCCLGSLPYAVRCRVVAFVLGQHDPSTAGAALGYEAGVGLKRAMVMDDGFSLGWGDATLVVGTSGSLAGKLAAATPTAVVEPPGVLLSTRIEGYPQLHGLLLVDAAGVVAWEVSGIFPRRRRSRRSATVSSRMSRAMVSGSSPPRRRSQGLPTDRCRSSAAIRREPDAPTDPLDSVSCLARHAVPGEAAKAVLQSRTRPSSRRR